MQLEKNLQRQEVSEFERLRNIQVKWTWLLSCKCLINKSQFASSGVIQKEADSRNRKIRARLNSYVSEASNNSSLSGSLRPDNPHTLTGNNPCKPYLTFINLVKELKIEINQLKLLNRKLVEKTEVLESKLAIKEQNSQVQQLLTSKSVSNCTSANEDDTLHSESEARFWYAFSSSLHSKHLWTYLI